MQRTIAAPRAGEAEDVDFADESADELLLLGREREAAEAFVPLRVMAFAFAAGDKRWVGHALFELFLEQIFAEHVRSFQRGLFY